MTEQRESISSKTHLQAGETREGGRGGVERKKKMKKITLCQVSFTVSEMPVVHFSTPLVSNGEGTVNQNTPITSKLWACI